MKKLTALLLLVIGVSTGASIAHARDGDLDTSWGGTGVVNVLIGSDPNLRVVSPYGSSKVVAAGFTDMGGSGYDTAYLARFLEDGSLDTTCAGTGVATTPGASSFLTSDMVVLSNGRVVVVGQDLGTPSSGVIAMFDSACQLVTGFGSGGIVAYTERQGVEFRGVAQGPNDTLVIGGSVFFAPVDGGDSRPFVMRLNTDGSFDTTFGDSSSGRWVAPANHEGYITDLLVHDDGRVTFTGVQFDATENQMVGRLTATGAVDTTFATSGWYVPVAPNAERSHSITRRVNGSFVIAGVDIPESGTSLTESEGSILCLTETGASDTSCGLTGRVTFSLDGGDDGFWDIEADDRGRILVSGFVSLASNSFSIPSPVLLRLTSDMALDTTFGATGSMVVPFNHGHFFGVSRDVRGRVLVGGIEYVGGPTEARILRLDSTNAPTTTVAPPPTVSPQLLPATGSGTTIVWPQIMMALGLLVMLTRRLMLGSRT